MTGHRGNKWPGSSISEIIHVEKKRTFDEFRDVRERCLQFLLCRLWQGLVFLDNLTHCCFQLLEVRFMTCFRTKSFCFRLHLEASLELVEPSEFPSQHTFYGSIGKYHVNPFYSCLRNKNSSIPRKYK